METNRDSTRNWFFEQLAARLAEVFEAMTKARPEIRSTPVSGPVEAREPGGLCWRQTFNGAPGAVWIQASEKDWTEVSNRILRAAGIEDADQPARKSTCIETLAQALSGIARDLAERLGREVACAAGEESQDPSPGVQSPVQWARLKIQFQGEAAAAMELTAAMDEALLDALPPNPLPPPPNSIDQPAIAAAGGSSGLTSKTFDLLLDVELPVSISFGRAQVPLKDVIKLTTGAIVELNRSITEPVEVIVNNCVIARGEVVVVEGNFGVRIREVISRQDRLRTLN